MRRAAIPLLLLISFLPTQAQEPETLHVSTQLVLLDATVEVKKSGARIPNLMLSDLTLTEDHHPQTLTYLSTDELPLSITLLFDVTESVMPVLHELANGANDVLLHLKPTDEVAVLTISSHTYLLQPFTTDRALAFAAIRRAAGTRQTNDPTFIYNDMVHVVRETAQSTIPNSRRVQLWLTDGTANREEDFLTPFGGRNGPKLPNKQDATDALLRSGQVVSELIEKSTITTRSQGQHDRLGDIQSFADLTGGPVVESSAPQVTARLSALIDQLRQRYTVGYKPSDPKPNGTLCHVELRLSDSFYAHHPEYRPKDLTIRTRTTYYR